MLVTVPQSAASVMPWMCTVKVSSWAMLASVQVRTSGFGAVLIEHDTPVTSPVGRSAVQTMPAGRLSVTTTVVAVPSPVFVTMMSNPISSPALTGPTGFATLSISISAHSTLIEPLSLLLPVAAAGSLVAATTAVFGMTAQFAPEVGALSVIVRVASSARSPKLQDRTSGSRAVLMEHEAALVPPSVHVYPAGRLSVSVTLLATPGPKLVTTIVNTAFAPALTLPLSGVLATVTSGHWTPTVARLLSPPSFVVVTVPVLLTVPQSAASVVPVTRTV